MLQGKCVSPSACEKKTLRILHINANYLTTGLYRTMTKSLTDAGVQSTIFATTCHAQNLPDQQEENVIASRCFRKVDRFLYHFKQRKIYDALVEKTVPNAFDCIHAHTLFTDGGVALRVKETYGTPYVVTVRNTDINTFFPFMRHLRLHGIKILQNASAIIFLSPVSRNHVFERYIPEDCKEQMMKKTSVIPNGIDPYWLSHMEPPREDTKTIRVLFAGTVDRNKNVLAILKALSILRARGHQTRFLAIGKTKSSGVVNRIKREPYAEYIEAQPKEKLIEYYRQSNLFVMPSFRESFGLVYAEALSQSLPVIYTQGQGFDGQFAEGTVGFHVNARDYRGIADAIEAVFIRYSEISRSCAACAERFDWNTIAQTLKESYRQCTGS